MTYKTILISLNDIGRTDAIIDAAELLTEVYDAHLIGCYVIPAVRIYPEIGSGTASVDDTQQQYYKSNLAAVKERFDARLRRKGLRGKWCAINSTFPEMAPALLEPGRASDLIVVPQTSKKPDATIESNLVERLVMESGRPVLIIPEEGTFAPVNSAVVGFNGTREASRAMFDAVPMLRTAKDVRVVCVDPYKSWKASGAMPGTEAASALARHGVKATAETQAASGANAGETLLQRVKDLRADLLVMGAYAHSRMREYIFGGATRHVLENANVPVLMSH